MNAKSVTHIGDEKVCAFGYFAHFRTTCNSLEEDFKLLNIGLHLKLKLLMTSHMWEKFNDMRQRTCILPYD